MMTHSEARCTAAHSGGVSRHGATGKSPLGRSGCSARQGHTTKGKTTMSDEETVNEDLLERIALLEDPDSNESILPPLPLKDVLFAVFGMLSLCIAMAIWGYGK